MGSGSHLPQAFAQMRNQKAVIPVQQKNAQSAVLLHYDIQLGHRVKRLLVGGHILKPFVQVRLRLSAAFPVAGIDAVEYRREQLVVRQRQQLLSRQFRVTAVFFVHRFHGTLDVALGRKQLLDFCNQSHRFLLPCFSSLL